MKKIFNLFRGFLGYNYGLTKNFNHPTALIIETTNICNLRCPICPRNEMTREQGFINDEVFKRAVEEAKKYTIFLWLHHFGEPLVDKKITERINYCKKHGIGVGISTNACLLDEDMSEKILNSGLDKILICFDGATKETYEKIRVGGDFYKTKENIFRFLKMKKSNNSENPRVIMQIIRMNDTEKEISHFKKEWGHLVDEVVVKDYSTWGNQVQGIKELSKQKHRFHKNKVRKRPPCYYLWHSLVIYWDGSVVMCCRDFDGKFILGNILETSLEDIWNGEKMVALRKAHIKGNFSNALCKDCEEYPDVAPSKFMFSKKNLKKVFRHMIKKSVA